MALRQVADAASDRLSVALDYAREGWAVFPCLLDKRPMTARGFLDATTDVAAVREWFGKTPQPNIGIACGASNIVVIDYDPRHDPEGTGKAWLDATLTPTRMARTGSGGTHFYYLASDFTTIRNSVSKLALGVDVRGDGGYVVAPPSISEIGVYSWLSDADIAPLPSGVVQACISPPEQTASSATAVTESIPEGVRNNTLISIAGTLQSRGLSTRAIEAALLAENEERCVPRLAESEVRRIVESVSRYLPGTPAPSTRLTLLTVADLLSAEDTQCEYVVDNLLPSGGVSVLVAKPKAGKSTLVQNLSLSVARGHVFLGRSTTPGPVILLALEEKRSELRARLAALGVTPDDPIYVHAGRAPDAALGALMVAIDNLEPVLVVIDTMQRFLRLDDINDYARVSNRLEPLLDVARSTGTHILLCHHANKAAAENGDASLGSTSIFGTVDTMIQLRRDDTGKRTIWSEQRYGKDMPKSSLEMDMNSFAVVISGEVAQQRSEDARARIMAFFERRSSPATTEEVKAGTPGISHEERVHQLHRLIEEGTLVRTGRGRSRSPYVYSRS